MQDDDTVRRARAMGLSRLVERHPAEVRQALETAEALAARLPKDLHWTEEPAHVLSLVPRKEIQ